MISLYAKVSLTYMFKLLVWGGGNNSVKLSFHHLIKEFSSLVVNSKLLIFSSKFNITLSTPIKSKGLYPPVKVSVSL